MKVKTILGILALGVVALFSACSSGNASYVEAGGSRSVVTTNKINIADWNTAAASLVNDLLASQRLESINPKPIKMKVSRIINRTSQDIDTDLLTKQIRMALNNSGKVLSLSEDTTAIEAGRIEKFNEGKNMDAPQIVMSGKIVEDRDSNNDVKEVNYVFMLEINKGGLIIWEGQKQLAKQSEKSFWGF